MASSNPIHSRTLISLSAREVSGTYLSDGRPGTGWRKMDTGTLPGSERLTAAATSAMDHALRDPTL
jgi:hypothetical protein